jgi:propanediol dehydratase large subunit
MALADTTLARMAVDVNAPRAEVVRLIGGTTPAKLARVVALLTPVEMQMAMSKMRARRTPSNQAHVTNQRDEPPTRPVPSPMDSGRSRRPCRC